MRANGRRRVRQGLGALLAVARLLAQSWRLWAGLALLGALMGAASARREPQRWASEGHLTLRPLRTLEGYLLATQEMGPAYARRLRDERRVARALAALGLPSEPRAARATVETWHAPGVLVWLRVRHPSPATAEALARALLLDFRAELEAENRRREEPDRLVIELSNTSFAHAEPAPWRGAAGRGGAMGLALGLALALAAGWQRRSRLLAPLEAEQLTGAPTLAAIPRR